MLDKLKKNKLYIKYGVLIIFIAIVVITTVKIITHGESMLAWIVMEVKNFFSIISPVLYAIIISYILYQPIKFIEKNFKNIYRKSSKKDFDEKYNGLLRGVSIFLVFLTVTLMVVLIYNFLIPPIIENIKGILDSLPEFQEQLKGWINSLVESLNSKNIDIQSTGELSNEIVDKVSLAGEQLLNFAMRTATNLSTFVVDFVVTLILTLYFLADKERLIAQMKKVKEVLLPERVGNAVATFFRDLDNIVGRFLVGEILDSIIVGFVSTGLLLLIKHPFAVLIGVIAGLTNIIPYIGPVIGAALAFFFGIFTSVPMGIAGAVLLLIYQQIDGNFIQPKIVGDKIGLSPVWILIVVLIGGSYFGALGMILSMPLAGLLRIYFIRYSEYKKRKLEEIQ
ncbi:MAG: AI-2E family transporter [Clostridium sp.]